MQQAPTYADEYMMLMLGFASTPPPAHYTLDVSGICASVWRYVLLRQVVMPYHHRPHETTCLYARLGIFLHRSAYPGSPGGFFPIRLEL